MKKILSFCIFLLIIFLTGCPFMEKTYVKCDLDFEFSKEEIRVNEPVELLIRYNPGELNINQVYIIKLMNDVDMQLLEGTLLECDVENIMFVDFVRLENQIESDSEKNDDLLPYCKLSLIFKKAGTYDFCIRRTDKNDPIFHFSTCIHEEISVKED